MDDIESKIPVVNGNDLSVASAMSNGQDPQQFLTIAMLVLFVAFIVLELIKPFGKINKKAYGSSFLTNTTAFIFNNIILSLLSASSLFLIAQNYSYLGLLGRMDESFVKFLISFLLFDLSIYIYHYCSHHNEFLWRFHKIHHSDKSFNVTTGFRFHIFDNIIELLYKSIVIVVLGLNAYTVLICELIKALFVMFHHCNISFKGESFVSKLIITPSLHRTHHSKLRSQHDSNYAIVFSIWDIIFGTRKEDVPEEIGLELIEAENFAQLFSLAFITEKHFLKILRMLPKGRR